IPAEQKEKAIQPINPATTTPIIKTPGAVAQTTAALEKLLASRQPHREAHEHAPGPSSGIPPVIPIKPAAPAPIATLSTEITIAATPAAPTPTPAKQGAAATGPAATATAPTSSSAPVPGLTAPAQGATVMPPGSPPPLPPFTTGSAPAGGAGGSGATPRPPKFKEKSFELRLGTFWLPLIGIVLLVTGLVFFGNYAYQNLIVRLN